jgi:hypothetical protein
MEETDVLRIAGARGLDYSPWQKRISLISARLGESRGRRNVHEDKEVDAHGRDKT